MELLGGFVGVDSWNTWFGWLKEFVGKVNGCDMSGRVYPCSCTVTVDLSLGSQAGSYLTRSICYPHILCCQLKRTSNI